MTAPTNRRAAGGTYRTLAAIEGLCAALYLAVAVYLWLDAEPRLAAMCLGLTILAAIGCAVNVHLSHLTAKLDALRSASEG